MVTRDIFLFLWRASAVKLFECQTKLSASHIMVVTLHFISKEITLLYFYLLILYIRNTHSNCHLHNKQRDCTKKECANLRCKNKPI